MNYKEKEQYIIKLWESGASLNTIMAHRAPFKMKAELVIDVLDIYTKKNAKQWLKER